MGKYNYNKTNWIGGKTIGTADVMNNLEEGVYQAHEQLEQNMKSINTYNLILEGCKGDGKTDNKEIIENIFNKLSDGDSIYIPYGTYLIKLSDSDLKDAGMSRKALYPWIILDNISNLTIFGNGVLKFECDSAMTKKASTFMFRDCPNIVLKDFTLQGDVSFDSSITYTDVGLNGINLVRCHNALVDGIKIYNMLAVLGATGELNTPTSSITVGMDTIFTNCIFKNYGQVSTFGSGVSRFIFTNNICINPMQCGLKISTNVEGIDAIDKANNILISNNIVYWESDYSFPQVGWEEGKTFCPVGFMVESHANNIKISNNIIDLSKITDTLLSPISDYSPIIVYSDYLENNLINEGIEIINNKLHSVNNKPSISFNPNLSSLIISGNELKGGLSGRTFTSNEVGKTKGIYIKNNVFLDSFVLVLKNIKTKNFVFSENDALNSSNDASIETIIFEENDIDYVLIENNKLPNEIIKTYNNLNCLRLKINNNLLNKISNLGYDTESGYVEIKNNSFTSKSTLATLRISDINTMIDYSSNTGLTDGSIINIDKGNIYLNNNSIKARTGIPYVLGDAIVMGGLFTGQGVPSQDAGVGVMYRNNNVVTPALYIKVGDGKGEDKWVEIINS